MKIIFFTDVCSHKAGGLYYSVSNLSKSIKKLDKYDVKVLGYFDQYTPKDIDIYSPVDVIEYKCPSIVQKFALSYDALNILKKEEPQIIHQQGIWLFHSLYTSKYKKKKPNCKVVISPRGMLDPWIIKRSPIKKYIAKIWFENQNLRKAECIHALCVSEYNSIREYGLKNPVAIIPNGTTIPQWKRNYDLIDKKKKKSILFLSRLHPKKGVKELIIAVKIIKETSPQLLTNWIFKIGGWGEKAYIEELEQIVVNNQLSPYFQFIGSVYGKEKEQLLKESDAFILPTYSEGLPMAILEAWAYGLPVITTQYSNIPEGFKTHSIFEITTDPSNMATQLTIFLNMDNDHIAQYGKNGLELVKKHFSWDIISKQTEELYQWLLGNQKELPLFIKMD